MKESSGCLGGSLGPASLHLTDKTEVWFLGLGRGLTEVGGFLASGLSLLPPSVPPHPDPRGPSANSFCQPPHRGCQGRGVEKQEIEGLLRGAPGFQSQAFISKQMFLISHPAHEGQKQLGAWQRLKRRLTASLLSSSPQTNYPCPSARLPPLLPKSQDPKSRRMDFMWGKKVGSKALSPSCTSVFS